MTQIKSLDLLSRAADEQLARAATYDQPEGERSMEKIVAIFNLHHGTALTEVQGWHFLEILKDVRFFSAPDFHLDSSVDGISYGSLRGEAAAKASAQKAETA